MEHRSQAAHRPQAKGRVAMGARQLRKSRRHLVAGVAAAVLTMALTPAAADQPPVTGWLHHVPDIQGQARLSETTQLVASTRTAMASGSYATRFHAIMG